MQDLSVIKYTPPNQENAKNPKSYEIKPLSSIDFTRIAFEGSDKLQNFTGFEYDDIMLLLKLGLVDPGQIETMPSEHHIFTGAEIYQRSILAEEERKNS